MRVALVDLGGDQGFGDAVLVFFAKAVGGQDVVA